jgi:hypothetical protein
MTLKKRQLPEPTGDSQAPSATHDASPEALAPRLARPPRPAPPSPRPPAGGALPRHNTRILLQEDLLPPAEQVLQDAVRRALRKPEGRIAVVMHLSAMTPPAPHPHHRRIARAVLEEAAQRHDGEVHVLSNGDAVLLCRLPPGGDPTGFRDALQYLFQVDAIQPALPISIWDLEQESQPVLAYVAERLTGNTLLPALPKPSLAHLAGEPDPDAAAEPAEGASLPGPRAIGPIAGLLRRRTAIRLEPRDVSRASASQAGRLRPLFREIGIAMGALERRLPGIRQARSDPFLMRTLAAELDELLLEAMIGDLPQSAGLWAAPGATEIPVHLNLSLAGILSPGFTRLADARGAAAIAVQLVEVCAEPDTFAHARARIEAAGFALVLDGISHLTLSLMTFEALRPDLVKLDWSPRLLRAPQAERERIDAALEALTPERIVLDRVESEEALRWGLERGVRAFQGRYADVLQATLRLGTCDAGRDCTVRQCASRAEAATPAGRAACGNQAMLDHGPGAELASRLAERAARSEHPAALRTQS